MNVFLRLLLAAVLAMVAQSALAHGPEGHGGEQQEESLAPAAASTPAPPVMPGSAKTEKSPEAEISAETRQSDDPAAKHGTASPSVWTRLHPATVHFPMALLLVAGLIEALAAARSSNALASTATVMTWAGAAGAVIAVVFGWIHTGLWFGGEATMQWHRWTGTGLAIVTPIAALLANREDRRPFRVLLSLIAFAVLAQGYWGAEIAHGPNHLGL